MEYLKIIFTLAILGLSISTIESFAEIQVDEKYYYDLGDPMIINGKLIGYDNFLFKSNFQEFEPVKINIYSTQDIDPYIFEIRVFPYCVNGDYPNCDFIFNNSLSLSRDLGFTDAIYNVDIFYGSDKTSYQFGINNHSVEARESMNTKNTNDQQIGISLDKSGYQLGDTVTVTAFTNFGFKQVLTVSVEQIDSPVFDPTRYGSYDISLDYNQYDNTFTTSIPIGDSDKRLGHYKITVFDNLDNAVKYFKVSETGLEIIPDIPTLKFENPYVFYGDYLYFSGYFDNGFDVRYDLSAGSYDTKRIQSDDAMLVGNNVQIKLGYDSDDFKTIVNNIYINMNEVGFFTGKILITRNMPYSEIIDVTARTNSQNTISQFVILPDESNETTYYDNIHDCVAQRDYLETHMQYDLTDDCIE